MKSYLSRPRLLMASAGLAAVALLAHAELPLWLQTAVAGSSVEAALYRTMQLPGISALFPRPPAEARAQLDTLLQGAPSAELYVLRARVDEQSLDFAAAEEDWKKYVAMSRDKAGANFELADFYQRRNEGAQEVAALEAAAAEPSPSAEQFLPADHQRAWLAFPQAAKVAEEQGLGEDAIVAIYHAWVERYPGEPATRAALLQELLALHRFDDAQRAIDDYRKAFPNDQAFPIKAAALLAFDEGTSTATQHALTLLEASYQPLWPDDLTASWLHLLEATHMQHAMLAASRASLIHNPDDLAAACKMFAYYQQQGHSALAVGVVTAYAESKEQRHAAWSATELYSLATLLTRAQQYEVAARYDYSLATATGSIAGVQQSPAEAGLCGLIHILLVASNQPLTLGAGNLSLYRDLANTDSGPGYLNGVLSLWLNSDSPSAEFDAEEAKATPYFHRAKAAELLAVLDERFPHSEQRATLHAELMQAYLAYGDDNVIKQLGGQFLHDYPSAPDHLQIALAVADADARTKDTAAEFALYDTLLGELSTHLAGEPLTAGGVLPAAVSGGTADTASADDGTGGAETAGVATTPGAAGLLRQSLNTPVNVPATTASAAAYRQVLDRYLDRLVTAGQQPAALAVLRKQLDSNPNDPLLYERLADFLAQNNLDAQQEEVYKQALARFNSTSFYDKLARFYLSKRRQSDFDALSRKVVDIFSGTPLEGYFSNVDHTWPQEYLQLNLYAHKRFPHALLFTRNLLVAYRTHATADPGAYDRLLREHWQDSPDLEAEFFSTLARDGELNDELGALKNLTPESRQVEPDTAASRELAQIYLWQSHFEQSAPLLAQLAKEYPADTGLGEEASSVFRSLSYYDPNNIVTATEIAKHLYAAEPTNTTKLATIGDIYANSTASSLNLDTEAQMEDAAPYFRRIAEVHPGVSSGYLDSATVFWDYFQFDDALGQIEAARTRFHDGALFAYQAGAIDEGKRDYPHAIAEYVLGATTDNSDQGDAHSRLLSLASRPQLKELVEDDTLSLATRELTVSALTLRYDVLAAQHREPEIAPLAESAVAHASTEDALEALAAFSEERQLRHAYLSALEREVSLASDPTRRIELKYQLAQAYIDEKNSGQAATIITSVYHDNPRLLGVVRHTVDFYWKNKQQAQAIAVLVEATRNANPTLAHDFTLEAIDKSNQSGDYAGARALLQPLLAADPFEARYLSLEAQSYSLAHNEAAVRDLYASTIQTLKASPMTVNARRDKIALARQAMIPALSLLKDYAGATDQHIALISDYPEDDAILQSATAYARLHQCEQQLTAFLHRAVADSPHDARFAIDLARVDVQFEDYAGALTAYSKAIAIRRDRADLFIARADLEEHQQAYDAASADYDRIYVLTYHDPQWLQKEALARARQGKPDLAVKALRTAWIDGRPASAANQFQVAQQLESWGLLAQADPFALEGVKLAGSELLSSPKNQDGALLYARILALERKAPEAFTFFEEQLASVNSSPSAPSVIVQQVEQHGIASVADADWRKAIVAAKLKQAQSTYKAALLQVASVVAERYTPEEKSAFATVLDAQRANRSLDEVSTLWIPMAEASNLRDREALWRRDVLLSKGRLAAAELAPLQQLERSRMDDSALGETLDTYAASLKPTRQTHVLQLAAQAWQDAGNMARESMDLRKLVLAHRQQQNQERLFALYLQGNRGALLQLVATKDTVSDAAANYIAAHGDEAFSMKAVTARGPARPAVWSSAMTALLGLYYGDNGPPIDAAFRATLGDSTIASELAAKPDAQTQLSGDPWFYYGSRYGLFLALNAKPSHPAEDYLAAEVELASSDPSSYTALAQTYLEAHNLDAAITEYHHALELAPDDPTPYLLIGQAYWKADRRDEAIAAFNEALSRFRAMVDLRAVPETFWSGIALVCQDAQEDHLIAQLKPGLDGVLAAYLRKNGSYRADELLHSIGTAYPDGEEHEAAVWTLNLIAEAPADAQLPMLDDVTSGTLTWLPSGEFEPFFQRALTLTRATTSTNSAGDAGGDETVSALTTLQMQYARWLLNRHRAADAADLLANIPTAQRQTDSVQSLLIEVDAALSHLPVLIESWNADPTSAPSLDIVRQAANALRLANDHDGSRLLLEFVFQQELQTQSLSDSSYLALAEARIATNDLAGGLDLLHRLILQGDFYDNLDSAASLLERAGHPVDAISFLEKLADGTPWNAGYRVRLGEALLAAKRSADAQVVLAEVASNARARYADRTAAAQCLADVGKAPPFDSAELNLLATGKPSAQAVDQPYFVYARMIAAQAVPLAQRAKLLRDALGSAPSDLNDVLHLRLFQTEVAASHFAQAQAAITPLIESHPELFSGQRGADDGIDPTDTVAAMQQVAGSMQTEQGPSNPYAIGKVLASSEERLAVLLPLAAMEQHLGNLSQSFTYVETAITFSVDTKQVAALRQRKKLMQDQLMLAQRNAERRPLFQAALTPAVVVRPRLTSLAKEAR